MMMTNGLRLLYIISLNKSATCIMFWHNLLWILSYSPPVYLAFWPLLA